MKSDKSGGGWPFGFFGGCLGSWVFGGVALLHEHDAVEWIRSHLVMGIVSPTQQAHTSVSRTVNWVLLGAWQCDAALRCFGAVALLDHFRHDGGNAESKTND